MLEFIVRIFIFFGAIALIGDGFFPVAYENLIVDQHTSNVGRDTNRNGHPSDTSYTLHFIGGRTKSCPVGMHSYSTLSDGDKVIVRTSKIFKKCVRIEKDGTLIYDEGNWRLITAIFGVMLLFATFSKNTKRDEDTL